MLKIEMLPFKGHISTTQQERTILPWGEVLFGLDKHNLAKRVVGTISTSHLFPLGRTILSVEVETNCAIVKHFKWFW